MDKATAIKQRAQALIQRGAFSQAMAEYQKLLGLEPVNPYAYILLGDLAERMGSRADALRRYGEAVDAYEALGLNRNAIAVLKKMLRFDPGQVESLRRLADLYAREGLVAESVAHYLDYGTRRLEAGREDETRQVLDVVARLGTPGASVAGRMADLCLALGDAERAALELLRAAGELEARGQTKRARGLRTRAAEIAPDARLAETSLALGGYEAPLAPGALEGLGAGGPAAAGGEPEPEIERAGDLFAPAEETEAAAAAEEPETAAADEPDEPELRAELEQCLKSGDRARAEAIAARLVECARERDDRAAEARWLAELGDLHLTAGEWDSARDHFAHALELDPEQSLARRRLDRLAALGAASGGAASSGAASSGAASSGAALELPDPGVPAPVSTPEPSGNAALEDHGLASVVDRFREDVSAQLGAEDHASHYDLGMTYMEMGLIREAIAEFRLALEGSAFRRRCLELLATCYSRNGEPELAAAHLRAAHEEA